ncbi:hypothetical protein K492DRAFT_235418 [Lichtheimia hyalospora FSU 10163]|uniref:RRM domain-containing protein n=1 Tax=Lichtheimia ornata TaxID=688661 RepID=A0AAD7V1N3_9FUNG|nr:uncharacterized protein O0I10_006499 [Lichtheimia ornata]KAI7883484.1 hypothetical protein K492DRAFT_235418 [Lichtheimia hyalospora FSU 10163]KAJ8657684.1 hypothetical protein O0I10_006499 [Lichtheimia ornata]
MSNTNTESKTTAYVGGLDHSMTEELVHAAFIPFGDIVSVQLANDPGSRNPHKGYGFVEFEEEEDCEAAIDNMNLAELHGKVIKVTKAKPHRVLAGSNRAVWSDDAWLQKHAVPQTEPAEEAKSPSEPPPPSP